MSGKKRLAVPSRVYVVLREYASGKITAVSASDTEESAEEKAEKLESKYPECSFFVAAFTTPYRSEGVVV